LDLVRRADGEYLTTFISIIFYVHSVEFESQYVTSYFFTSRNKTRKEIIAEPSHEEKYKAAAFSGSSALR